MQGTSSSSLSSSSGLPPKSLCSLHLKQRKLGSYGKKPSRIYASRRDMNDRKRCVSHVDEDMIVLRKRIGDMKMEEADYEASSNWMQWEKKYYAYYASDICEAVGLLQRKLLDTRPSLALGIAILLALSTTLSTGVIILNFFMISKWLLYGIVQIVARCSH